jgi:hypothetical protein
MKHCRNGPRAGVGVTSPSLCGKGGGRVVLSVCDGAGTGGGEAGASAGAAAVGGATSESAGVEVPAGASEVNWVGVVSGEVGTDDVAGDGGVDGSSAGFDEAGSEGGSFSFRFLRKNAISLRNSSGTLLLRSSRVDVARDTLLRPPPFVGM